MTATGLSASDRSTLHVFRPVARDVDAALRLTPPGRQALRVVNGYVESDRDAGRMRKLCIRVRRISLARDPINFLSGAGDRPAVGSGPLAGQAKALAQRFAPIAEELESVSVFGDRRVTNGEAYETRIDARVFVEAPDRTGRYRRMVSEPEPAIEGIAMHLGDRIVGEITRLDTLVAEYLGEPAPDPGEAPPAQKNRISPPPPESNRGFTTLLKMDPNVYVKPSDVK